MSSIKSLFNNNHGSFTDMRDGKLYHAIQIGKQICVAQNLKYNFKGYSFSRKPNSKCENFSEVEVENYYKIFGRQNLNDYIDGLDESIFSHVLY